jgi:hypothetical protein
VNQRFVKRNSFNGPGSESEVVSLLRRPFDTSSLVGRPDENFADHPAGNNHCIDFILFV